MMVLSSVYKAINGSVQFFDCIDSTSLYLKRCILQKETVPALVIAKEQTNGQGRVGKEFYSPPNTGLYMTFSFPEKDFQLNHLTPRVALAAAEAIEAVCKISCGLKWVNDIYWNGGKICGILCQKVEEYILIGVGINVEKPTGVPENLTFRFQSIFETCDPSVYTELILAVYSEFMKSRFLTDQDVANHYRKRCIHLNHPVSIINNNIEIFGLCREIADDFSIVIEFDQGRKSYSSGILKLL